MCLNYTSVEKGYKAVGFLQRSAHIFRAWEEIDTAMAKRAEPNRSRYYSATWSELRSIIAAMFTMIDDKPDSESIDAIAIAEEHMNILVYESFSILEASLIEEIEAIKQQYDTDIIKTIFPKYYDTYLKDILAIQANLPALSDKRASRSVYDINNNDPHTSLEEMKADVLLLIDIIFQFQSFKPEFDKKNKEEINKKRWDVIKQVLYVVGGTVLGVILAKVFGTS